MRICCKIGQPGKWLVRFHDKGKGFYQEYEKMTLSKKIFASNKYPICNLETLVLQKGV